MSVRFDQVKNWMMQELRENTEEYRGKLGGIKRERLYDACANMFRMPIKNVLMMRKVIASCREVCLEFETEEMVSKIRGECKDC